MHPPERPQSTARPFVPPRDKTVAPPTPDAYGAHWNPQIGFVGFLECRGKVKPHMEQTYTPIEVKRWFAQLKLDPIPRLPRPGSALIIVQPYFDATWRVLKVAPQSYTITTLR